MNDSCFRRGFPQNEDEIKRFDGIALGYEVS
jgi:hypothetical protein